MRLLGPRVGAFVLRRACTPDGAGGQCFPLGACAHLRDLTLSCRCSTHGDSRSRWAHAPTGEHCLPAPSGVHGPCKKRRVRAPSSIAPPPRQAHGPCFGGSVRPTQRKLNIFRPGIGSPCSGGRSRPTERETNALRRAFTPDEARRQCFATGACDVSQKHRNSQLFAKLTWGIWKEVDSFRYQYI